MAKSDGFFRYEKGVASRDYGQLTLGVAQRAAGEMQGRHGGGAGGVDGEGRTAKVKGVRDAIRVRGMSRTFYRKKIKEYKTRPTPTTRPRVT